MNSYENWQLAAKDNLWKMPSVVWWKRWIIIRHIRAIYHVICVELWYARGPGSMYGYVRSGYDRWVLYGIWHGLENEI